MFNLDEINAEVIEDASDPTKWSATVNSGTFSGIISTNNKLNFILYGIVYDQASGGYSYLFHVVSGNDESISKILVEQYLDKYEYFIYAYGPYGSFFEVYEDDKKLVLGVDYTYSLNNKSEWLEGLPPVRYFYKSTKEKIAGTFYIKLKDTDYNKLYSVKYKIDKKQNLTQGIDLINEKMQINKEYQDNYGFIQNIILCKNSFKDSEEICIIDEYTNIIFENEFKEKSGKSIVLSSEGLFKNKKR
jgi:hypothetical protein